MDRQSPVNCFLPNILSTRLPISFYVFSFSPSKKSVNLSILDDARMEIKTRTEAQYKMLMDEKQRILSEIRKHLDAETETEVRIGFELYQDNADKSVGELEKHISSQLTGVRSEMLDLIDDAFTRLREGTYGLCDDCGNEIPIERLRVLPFVSRCVRCQEHADRIKKIEQSHETEFQPEQREENPSID